MRRTLEGEKTFNIYIYIYVCVCVCVYINTKINNLNGNQKYSLLSGSSEFARKISIGFTLVKTMLIFKVYCYTILLTVIYSFTTETVIDICYFSTSNQTCKTIRSDEVYHDILHPWRCPWCNGYRSKKWTRRHEFKSWPRPIAFLIALIPLGKV